jgi:hypothetical protein
MLLESAALAYGDTLPDGWRVEREGLCRGDVCVAWRESEPSPHAIAQAFNAPLVHDPESNLWAIGPPAAPHAIQSAQLPNIVLPDLDGRSFELASLRGGKVFLLAWASW